MKQQSIGCTLSPAEQALASAEYAAAASDYQASAAVDGHRARVTLRGERETLRGLLDRMIARESRCCAFLQFEQTETADGAVVRISVREHLRAEVEPGRLARFIRGVFPGVVIAGD